MWFMEFPEQAVSVTRATFEGYWLCAVRLSAVNAIGTQLRPDQLSIDPMAVDGINGRLRGKRESREEGPNSALVWIMSGLKPNSQARTGTEKKVSSLFF